MLYLPILVPKCRWEIWHQKIQKGREVQGNHPWNGHTYHGEKLCQNWMWVVKEVLGEGERHPCQTYLPTEEYVYEVVDWIGGLGLL